MTNQSHCDILKIDDTIKSEFKVKEASIPTLTHKLKQLEKTLENTTVKGSKHYLHNRINTEYKTLLDSINKIESKEDYNFYIMESVPIITRYKEILNTPVKISFIGKSTNNPHKEEKKTLTSDYLKIASKYILIEHKDSTTIKCPNCKSPSFDIIDNNTYICTECYNQQYIVKHTSCYSDIDRVNISGKYKYDPKIHFKDCIKQYQGKENCNISPQVYENLISKFESHHLLVGDKNTPQEQRFSKITKNQIMIFLKDLEYSKHYENVNLIYSNITGKKCNDISHLEDKLLSDFDKLISLYYEKFKNINRDSFINTQYVLYQLLRHHRYPCKDDEFSILKTIDRKYFHDDVCKTLFNIMELNHFPFY